MSLLLFLAALALLFAGAGVVYALRRAPDTTLEAYTTARGSVGGVATALTLFASGMGGWLLFSPAEAAVWGGVPNLVGYAVGSALPLLIFLRLGLRLRRLAPQGHTLTEFVFHRYGRAMHAFVLVLTLFYLFVFLAAEITGLALMMELAAGVPRSLSAGVVLTAALTYTTLGGLRASIFTDGLQTAVILPLFALVTAAALALLGGLEAVVAGTAERAPELLGPGYGPGLEGAVTLVLAIAAANLFDQGFWQRVYAARDEQALRRGFWTAAVLILPVVLMMGLFGLAAVAFDRAETPSIAFFSVVLGVAPTWLVWSLAALGLLLVMSSADTILNAAASLIAVDARRFRSGVAASELLRVSRWATVGLAVPVLFVAAQGYSVLYLFLVADLVCAAAVFPVFFGLYDARYDGRTALLSAAGGLFVGLLLFPDPTFTRSAAGFLFDFGWLEGGSLLGAFAAALGVPVVIALLHPRRAQTYDFASLERVVQPFGE